VNRNHLYKVASGELGLGFDLAGGSAFHYGVFHAFLEKKLMPFFDQLIDCLHLDNSTGQFYLRITGEVLIE
jgi:hypothetical protein